MTKGIIGRKLGMTQIFDPKGRAVPVTVIEAGPCTVVQVKTPERDGYRAVQLGFGERDEKELNKPEKGHLKKAGLKPPEALKEIRVEDLQAYEVGGQVRVDMFDEGERVDIVGTSKGKGFAGVVKRYHFKRGPMSHGSMYHRGVGALGGTDPARVFKGRKLPGRMGFDRVTIRNIEVVKVDPERNLLLVRGAVPGTRGRLVLVKNAARRPGAARRKK